MGELCCVMLCVCVCARTCLLVTFGDAVVVASGTRCYVMSAVMQKSALMDSSGLAARLDADADETFRAFTETVEALALQKSVIGELYCGIAHYSEFANMKFNLH